MSDRHLLDEAFEELERRGYAARQNFMCCMGCGCAALGEEFDEEKVAEKDRKWVFWHDQDHESAFGDGENFEHNEENIGERGLMLAWGGDGAEIVNVLRNHGLDTEWDGSEGTRILVKHHEAA